MKRTYVELSCDSCGQAEMHTPGFVNEMARQNGWIIDRQGHAFCSTNCRSVFRDRKRTAAEDSTQPHNTGINARREATSR